MSNKTDLERIDEYMKLQQFAGKMSDQVFNSWKALAKEIKAGFEIKNPSCSCGKDGKHHYCHECYGDIQEVLNIVC